LIFSFSDLERSSILTEVQCNYLNVNELLVRYSTQQFESN